jgi:hypothetical protein
MRHGLACWRSHIDTDIVASGLVLCLNEMNNLWKQTPEGRLLFGAKVKIVSNVSPGNDQRMARGDGESICERDGYVRREEYVACRDTITERAPRPAIRHPADPSFVSQRPTAESVQVVTPQLAALQLEWLLSQRLFLCNRSRCALFSG